MIENNFIELGLVYLLAAMMPGPSIGLILRNSIISKQAGFQAALATVVGTSLQIALVLIILLINKNFGSCNYFIVKLICSLYLVYVGFKTMLLYKEDDNNVTGKTSNRGYFYEAFCVEFTNPLAFTFFISIMTMYIDMNNPIIIIAAYWVELTILAALWFLSANYVLSSKLVTRYTTKYRRAINIVTGALFIILAIKNIVFLVEQLLA